MSGGLFLNYNAPPRQAGRSSVSVPTMHIRRLLDLHLTPTWNDAKNNYKGVCLLV